MKALWSVKSPYSLGSISSFSDKSNLKKKKNNLSLDSRILSFNFKFKKPRNIPKNKGGVGWCIGGSSICIMFFKNNFLFKNILK
jgi:hypothetical protein